MIKRDGDLEVTSENPERDLEQLRGRLAAEEAPLEFLEPTTHPAGLFFGRLARLALIRAGVVPLTVGSLPDDLPEVSSDLLDLLRLLALEPPHLGPQTRDIGLAGPEPAACLDLPAQGRQLPIEAVRRHLELHQLALGWSCRRFGRIRWRRRGDRSRFGGRSRRLWRRRLVTLPLDHGRWRGRRARSNRRLGRAGTADQ